jgi:hypothetical protein
MDPDHRMILMGLEILLVEDSWIVGEAVKDLLELLGTQRVPKSLAASVGKPARSQNNLMTT